MSNFRERTAAIVEQGEAERKSFAPKGAPQRVYDYWLNKSESSKAHKIRNGLRRENFCHWFWVVVFFAPSLAIGRFIDRHSWVLGLPFFALAATLLWMAIADFGVLSVLLTIAAVVAFVAAIIGAGIGVEKLHAKFPTFMNRLGIGVFGLAIATLFGAVLYLFVSSTGTIGAGILVALGLTIGVVVWKFQTIASYIEGREEIREQERAERRANAPVDAEPREPSRLDKFFKGAGEFFVMVAQFVRVKKWKTCPLIDVTPEQRGEAVEPVEVF